MTFDQLRLLEAAPIIAPDGSTVRVLLRTDGGSVAHFQLAGGDTSRAVVHRTVEEIWYVISGFGEMWRSQGERQSIVALQSGVSLTIPVGTCFQFRNVGVEPLTVVGLTMPPWPGNGEAEERTGAWPVSLKT